MKQAAIGSAGELVWGHMSEGDNTRIEDGCVTT